MILDNVAPLGVERVSLLESAGRALAEDVVAPWDLPRCDNSAMDGYAVRSADCAGPSVLPVIGCNPAGGPISPRLEPGCAVRIMTGAPVPDGCDAVVPLEDAEDLAGRVKVDGPVKLGAHIRRRGEDVAAGRLVVPAGTVLRPPEISMLASFGRAFVPVHRRARVAVLSTGDELVELGEPLPPLGVVNSNSLSLAAALREAGAAPVILGIARDDRGSLREKLAAGFDADALITSAGVSMGDRDLVRAVLSDLSVREIFWKIRMRPGSPTAFGLKDGKPVFSLPGNPVSSLVVFEELVRPALLRMMGHAEAVKPFVKARLKEPVRKKAGRAQFLRIRMDVEDGAYVVREAGDQSTGMLKTLVLADGLAYLPADRTDFQAGETVDVHLLYPRYRLP